MAALGRVSPASPVHTAVRNCTKDYEGCPFKAGSQVLAASHRKLLRTKAAVRKRRDKIPAGKVERGERKRTVDEVSKAD